MEPTAPATEDPGIARYAIWLVPQSTTEERFAGLIEELAQRYSCPRFAPHVTLLGGLSGPEDGLAEKTAALAGDLSAVPVSATGLAMEPYYFRNFYLKLEPSAALLLAYQHATRSFSTKARNFAPHLSLLYGSVARKDRIALGAEIHTRVPASFTLDRVYLVRTTLAVPNWTIVSRHELPPAP